MPELLQSDTNRFPSETMDGETVLIDADRGHLLLLTGLGAWLWTRFDHGADRDVVLGEIESAFGGDARAECDAFMTSMRERELLTEIEDGTMSDASPGPPPATYEPPAIESFEDVSEIIQMDPIHEVDPEAGWPNPRGA